MKIITPLIIFSALLLSACSSPEKERLDDAIANTPGSNEVIEPVSPTVSIHVNSAEETAQKIIEAVPNAKVTQKKEDGIMTLALDYKWEETNKIDQLLTKNSTDGNIFGAKQMIGLLQEEEDALKAQDYIRLVVTLVPVALLKSQ